MEEEKKSQLGFLRGDAQNQVPSKVYNSTHHEGSREREKDKAGRMDQGAGEFHPNEPAAKK